MNTKRTFSTIVLTTLLASTLVIGTSAYASPEGGKHFKGKPSPELMQKKAQKRLDRMAKKLGLSDEQKQQVKALRENRRNSMKPLRQQRKSLRKQMALLDPKASDFDQNVAEIANTKAELTRSMTIARGESRKQMAQILTTEQLVKMKEIRGKRKAFRHGMKHGKRHFK